MGYQVQLFIDGAWQGPDAEVYETFDDADAALAAAQVFVLDQYGLNVRGRLIDAETDWVVHEHEAPRRVSSWN